MTKIFVAPDVANVEALHPYINDDGFRKLPIRNQIERQAATIKSAHANKNSAVRMHLTSWWPGARGRSFEEILESRFSDSDALLTMSREYGFDDWNAVKGLGNASCCLSFERALDHLLAGDIGTLRSDIASRPALVTARSAYGHQATLLHYLGANGVESHRQKTPLNAVELARLLIDHGADIGAKAKMYGGLHTAFELGLIRLTSQSPSSTIISFPLCR